MDYWVRKINLNVLPIVFKKIGYKPSDSITVIAFNHNCEKHVKKVEDFRGWNLKPEGGTKLQPAISALESELEQVIKNGGTGVRILAISDGEVFDKSESLSAAEAICLKYKNRLRINTQAMQVFSCDQANPDTVALCSLLQFNNTKSTQLVNINTSLDFDTPVNELVDLLKDDGVDYLLKIESESGKLFKKEMWSNEFSKDLALKNGENCFWMDPVEAEKLIAGKNDLKYGKNSACVKIQVEPKHENIEEVHDILINYLNHVYEHLKVLRIINSAKSNELMKTITEKFMILESQLTNLGDIKGILAKNDISSRVRYLRQELKKRMVGFSAKMAEIANDSTIDALNSAQKAEYLRSTAHSKTSRGLARRAATGGFEFDDIARKEVLEIAKHLDELQEISDSEHQCSFYSMETTLGGIRSVAEMTKDANFDDITAREILMILNIVGIACDGPVGDFPDPMTYRINRIYPGVFVSVSDMLTTRVQMNQPDLNLNVPGRDEDCLITNSVPVFEDQRIANFLRKYAPNLLSYTCSVGMRGMIAHVPMTDGYTLCSGIWKLVEHLARDPTELNLKTFSHLVESYSLFAGSYFKSSNDCLIAESLEDGLSFYLKNNGLTNMIAPIYQTCVNTNKYVKMKKNTPAILRALFSHEIWQVFRREVKGATRDESISVMLNKLLGIDLDRDAVPTPPLFELEPSFSQINFPETPNFDFEYLNEFIKSKGWYLKYVSLIILLLERVHHKSIFKLKNGQTLESQLEDNSFLEAQYGLSYDFQEFLMYSAIQSLMFPAINDRFDKENEKMNISDLVDPTQIKEMIKNYIKTQFKSRYDSDMVARRKNENAELRRNFFEKLRSCTERKEMINLFRNGVTIKTESFKYKGLNSLGFLEMKQIILDTLNSCPLRKDLIVIFLLACDVERDNAPLYNDGKSSAVNNIEEIERVFLNYCGGTKQEWDKIFVEHKIRCVHSYRTPHLPNRHGHHNDKPSYWALGYLRLEEYAKANPDDFEKYCQIHYDCCGVDQIPFKSS